MENNNDCMTVSIVSGKGGAGKTSIALTMTRILADAGFRVALVDFDLTTGGSSLFLRKEHEQVPAQELIVDHVATSPAPGEATDSAGSSRSPEPLKVRLVPVTYRKWNESDGLEGRRDQGDSEEPDGTFLFVTPCKLPVPTPFLFSHGLRYAFTTIVGELEKQSYDFIIVDNQAGPVETALAAACASDKVVMVREPDIVSGDAVWRLFRALSAYGLEHQPYCLNNKLHPRVGHNKQVVSPSEFALDAGYIHFDLDIMKAFRTRNIPVDHMKPTPFQIAVMDLVDMLIREPAAEEKFSKYWVKIKERSEHFERTEKELKGVIEKLENRLSKVTEDGRRSRGRLLLAGAIAGVNATMLAGICMYLWMADRYISGLGIPMALALLAFFTGILVFSITKILRPEHELRITSANALTAELDHARGELEQLESYHQARLLSRM